ncbi:MAG: tail fiber domain-containing protein, partial [Steroidobacteraceae bacterium]
MSTISKWTTALLLLSASAHGQVPSTNDTSDGNSNTGVGEYALHGPADSNTGSYNTVVGASAMFYNTTGGSNTVSGFETLSDNKTGNYNTASGVWALEYNIAGSYNTATGYLALQSNDYEGAGVSGNTADGALALRNNISGTLNTAVGYQALYTNVSSGYNTAVGYNALTANTGSFNSALGALALAANTSGGANTAFGNSALNANQSGANNTATGSNALYMNDTENTGASGNTADGAGAMNNNSSGNNNTAVGWQTLQGTTSGASGSNNTAIGVNALFAYSTGSNNIAVGYEAGLNVATGSDNIDIGNAGAAGDNKVIRIGTASTQKKIFIAGINDVSVTGSPVYIASNGQLGVVVSSERFKTAIAPMGSNTAKLDKLRPVTFNLKSDATGTRQYGLIAEEVAKVDPELIIRGQYGRIDGVRYDELAPMLLNEMQKHQKNAATQAAKIAAEDRRAA